MNIHFKYLSMIGFVLIMTLAACAPKPTPQADPNAISTAVAQEALTILKETAAASTPTPSATIAPASTPTEAATATPTANLASNKPPMIGNFTGCWYGPGPTYTLESNISKGKRVEILGVGSVPGWYVILNPYFHKPCWVQASQLENIPAKTTSLPVMTPGP